MKNYNIWNLLLKTNLTVSFLKIVLNLKRDYNNNQNLKVLSSRKYATENN